jgi:hypothetical protein
MPKKKKKKNTNSPQLIRFIKSRSGSKKKGK